MPYVGRDAASFTTVVDVTVSDDLTVTDDATIGGDLAVTGTTQSAQIGLGAAPHATAPLTITTTNQHIRMNNGSELGIIALLSSGELELWGHGDGESINFRTGSGNGTVVMNVVGSNVGIGTTSPDALLEIEGDVSSTTQFSGFGGLRIHNVNGSAHGVTAEMYLTAGTGGSNRGTAIGAEFTSASSGNDLYFATNGGNVTSANTLTERMRITSAGNVVIGANPSSALGGGDNTTYIGADGEIQIRRADGVNRNMMKFRNSSNHVGSITTTSSATTYATSSDYRLKENVVTDWDATSRLKQLKPSRFNFIVDADTTVDGFLAHEAQAVVPECVTGTKDDTRTVTNGVFNSSGNLIVEGIEKDNWTAGKSATKDDKDNDVAAIYPSDSTWSASKDVPVYQGIDQSKLVPLLVKTIQELEARIKTLEDA